MEVLYQLSYVGVARQPSDGCDRRQVGILSPGEAPDPPLALMFALLLVLAPAAAARPHDKLAGGLDELAQGKHPWAHRAGPSVGPVPGTVHDGKVLVDVYVSGPVRDRADALRGHGMDVEAVSGRAPERMVEGWLPVSALDDVAELDSTRAVVPVYEAGFNTGSATSEGDAAHRGPQARALGPTGTGIPVGVMSDSINQRGTGVAGSQSSGDLPATVQILDEPGSGTRRGACDGGDRLRHGARDPEDHLRLAVAVGRPPARTTSMRWWPPARR